MDRPDARWGNEMNRGNKGYKTRVWIGEAGAIGPSDESASGVQALTNILRATSITYEVIYMQ